MCSQQNKKKTDLTKLAELLKLENKILEDELTETTNMTIQIEQELAENHEEEIKKHAEKLSGLKKTNTFLKVIIIFHLVLFAAYQLPLFNY